MLSPFYTSTTTSSTSSTSTTKTKTKTNNHSKGLMGFNVNVIDKPTSLNFPQPLSFTEQKIEPKPPSFTTSTSTPFKKKINTPPFSVLPSSSSSSSSTYFYQTPLSQSTSSLHPVSLALSSKNKVSLSKSKTSKSSSTSSTSTPSSTTSSFSTNPSLFSCDSHITATANGSATSAYMAPSSLTFHPNVIHPSKSLPYTPHGKS
ncbi:hypothetical protein HMI56_007252 [Coelomomyces lativittatus]|nr:hypothetical protein HMI56_007252 [Coelomomyces lativittatus]